MCIIKRCNICITSNSTAIHRKRKSSERVWGASDLKDAVLLRKDGQRMKSWKKMNRGILLGGIVFVGVGCYVVVDQHNFKSEKPEIESVVTEFVEGLESYNVTPEKYREKGKELSDADAEALKKDYWEFIDKYWVSTEENTNSVYYRADKTQMKGQMATVIDNWKDDHSESCDIEVRECKVSKDGPGAAVAEIKVKYIVKGTPSTDFLTPNMTESMDWWMDNDGSAEEIVRTFSCNAEYVVYLERTSDGWKITGSDGYGMGVSEIASDDEDSGGDEEENNDPEALETENETETEADGEGGQTADEKAGENI